MNWFEILSNGLYFGPESSTSTQRAIFAVSWGLLSIAPIFILSNIQRGIHSLGLGLTLR